VPPDTLFVTCRNPVKPPTRWPAEARQVEGLPVDARHLQCAGILDRARIGTHADDACRSRDRRGLDQGVRDQLTALALLALELARHHGLETKRYESLVRQLETLPGAVRDALG